MVDFDRLRDELNKSEPPKIEIVSCSRCYARCRKFTVKKEGKNHGRPFTACRECEHFQWLDLPTCRKCGEYMIKFKASKKSKNPGRDFFTCANQCKGAFRWADNVPKA